MRVLFAPVALVLVIGASHASENVRPAGLNCSLTAPPAGAGVEFNHGATLRIFPQAKNIDAQYTGCQVLFAEDGKKWLVVSLTAIVKGDPVRVWSEQDPNDPSLSCRYVKGKVVRGNSNTCPAAEFLIVKSLSPSCARQIREAVATNGVAASKQKDCEYE